MYFVLDLQEYSEESFGTPGLEWAHMGGGGRITTQLLLHNHNEVHTLRFGKVSSNVTFMKYQVLIAMSFLYSYSLIILSAEIIDLAV
jgi:hypothetical protein